MSNLYLNLPLPHNPFIPHLTSPNNPAYSFPYSIPFPFPKPSSNPSIRTFVTPFIALYLDKLHGGEIVLVLLHGRDPGYIVKRDDAQAEVGIIWDFDDLFEEDR